MASANNSSENSFSLTPADIGEALNQEINEVWGSLSWYGLITNLAETANQITDSFQQIGDLCIEELQKRDSLPEKDLLIYYLTNYEWSEQAKSFLILWRDIIFQIQKGIFMMEEELTKEAELVQLKEESQKVALRAFEDLKNFIPSELEKASKDPAGIKKKIRQWKLQKNPWPTYKEQLNTLRQQCQEFVDRHKMLLSTSSQFKRIAHTTEEMILDCKKDLDNMIQIAQTTISYIEEETNKEKDRNPGRIAARLEDIEAEVLHTDHLHFFNLEMDQLMEVLPGKTQVAVNISQGLVEMNEINFKRRAQQWIDSEVVPVMLEVAELTESGIHGMKMTLINIRNRALLLAGESKEGKEIDFAREEIDLPLQSFLKSIKQSQQSIANLEHLIHLRLNTEFKFYFIYETNRVFLPVPLQSTINHLRLNRNQLIIRVQDWIKKKATVITDFRKTVALEERLSLSEKIVRYIQSRTANPENHEYSSIFLTKGYIGESFWVGREDQLEHMKKVIANWKNGFRGAVVISGQRFSGKTLFGEIIIGRHFPDKVIRVTPNAPISVGGRKLEAGHDLSEVLEFIIKYSLNSNAVVWVDDLELWRDPSIPLNQNIRALRKFIDTYSDKLFFMVSMSNWLKAHLNQFHDIDQIFQTEMNMDRLSAREIREAILIRHGATHKVLLGRKGEDLTPQIFRRLTYRVYQAAEGNIGEALNMWSFSTEKRDEDHVINNYRSGPSLPDFLSPDTALLLTSVMMQKRTNEYRLRKLFGPAFAEKYISTLQRMNSVGLLTRHLDGWLEINQLVVNDLGRLLEQKNYIRYHKWKD